MINLDEWFLLVRKRPSQLTKRTTSSIFASVARATHTSPGRPYGQQKQPTEWHYDGNDAWLVTYSVNRTYDDKKAMAYVVAHREVVQPLPRASASMTGLIRASK